MKTVKVLLQVEADASDLELPSYQTEGSSGMDLFAAEQQDVTIQPGEIKLVSTGIRVSIPTGYEIQIRPRSGLALKFGITLLNTPGTIDSDYRGIIKLILINLGKEAFVAKRGMRVAQMVIQEVVRAKLERVDSLDETVRAAGGFGHTGH